MQVLVDAKVDRALQQALDSADAAIKALDGNAGVSAQVQRAQLVGSRGAISRALESLFKALGIIVRDGQSSAAGVAAEAQAYAERPVLALIEPDSAKREVLREALVQQAERGVQSMMTRILQTERPLSKRIYRTEAIAKGQVGRKINEHLARNSSAAEIARDVRQFFDPKIAGGVSYAARRLARTEINNAFHAQSIADYQDRPWIQTVRWNLTKSHKEINCRCESYAQQALYGPYNVPDKPHPGCLCYITPEMDDRDTVLDKIITGQYQQWISENN